MCNADCVLDVRIYHVVCFDNVFGPGVIDFVPLGFVRHHSDECLDPGAEMLLQAWKKLMDPSAYAEKLSVLETQQFQSTFARASGASTPQQLTSSHTRQPSSSSYESMSEDPASSATSQYSLIAQEDFPKGKRGPTEFIIAAVILSLFGFRGRSSNGQAEARYLTQLLYRCITGDPPTIGPLHSVLDAWCQDKVDHPLLSPLQHSSNAYPSMFQTPGETTDDEIRGVITRLRIVRSLFNGSRGDLPEDTVQQFNPYQSARMAVPGFVEKDPIPVPNWVLILREKDLYGSHSLQLRDYYFDYTVQRNPREKKAGCSGCPCEVVQSYDIEKDEYVVAARREAHSMEGKDTSMWTFFFCFFCWISEYLH